MRLEIANIENFAKYANKMLTREPVGKEFLRLHSGDNNQ